MKSIGSILIVVIALHAQCVIDCLGASMSTASYLPPSLPDTPACHGGAGETPVNSSHDHSSRPDKSYACVQTQALQSRNDQGSAWTACPFQFADVATAGFLPEGASLSTGPLTDATDLKNSFPRPRLAPLRI